MVPATKCPECNYIASARTQLNTVVTFNPMVMRCYNCKHEFPVTQETQIDEATGRTYAEIVSSKSFWWHPPED